MTYSLHFLGSLVGSLNIFKSNQLTHYDELSFCKWSILKLKSRFCALLVLSTCAMVSQAQSINPLPIVDDEVRYSVGVSAWSPASKTSSFLANNVYAGSTQASVPDNIQRTGGFAMINAEAHQDNWGVMADLVYWQVNNGSTNTTSYINKKTSVYESQGANTDQTILSGALTYTVFNDDALYADALFGVRYISSTTSANVNSVITTTQGKRVIKQAATGYYSATQSEASPIIGLKGRYRINESEWFLPFYVDVGQGFDADNLTWQALGGVGYAFSWGDVALTYRAMYFELGGSQGLTKYSNYGPQLGITINF
ncbi:hypothetical protein [Polynucleobacter sphagniphilus]|uniref:hypothetical protein n=2 Tax=Polynucleobacter sphagniphilus TaxID=1743169 RepID=UPI00117F33C5|nr:hypothetical protein [Polynucleobacter sphagniphilus]